MSRSKVLPARVSPLAVAALVAVLLLLVAGFAPLPPVLVLVLYLAALAVGGVGLLVQRYRNNPARKAQSYE
jgi:hypothetical protein